MNLSHTITLVLADDQALIRQGLKTILNAEPDIEVVGEAADGEQAIDVTRRTNPHVVLMDIQMPKVNGIEATRSILQFLPDTKVVLLTTFDVEQYVFDGIRAGASGYLLKDSQTEDMLESIRLTHLGHAIYRTASASQAIAKAMSTGVLSADQSQLQLAEALTDRETEVLQQMAYGHRNSVIASALNVSEGTVKTHVHRILQKLAVEDRTQAVAIAIRHGIVK